MYYPRGDLPFVSSFENIVTGLLYHSKGSFLLVLTTIDNVVTGLNKKFVTVLDSPLKYLTLNLDHERDLDHVAS